MDRVEAVRLFVLSAIADTYEDIEQIRKLAECDEGGFTLSDEEIWHALVGLVGTNLARAYRLTATSRPAEELVGMPPKDEIDWNGESSVWFYITEPGKRVLNERKDLWDEDGNIIGAIHNS
jgi:hypothetical protein